MRFAALLLSLLALSIAPARSAEVATPNDTARFLAGLPPSPDSPLTPLTKDSSWQQHANRLNSIFGQEDRGHLGRVRAFSKARLTETHDTMLYFFSGPDALHALALFPNATNYVLAGLEPAGNIPSLTSLPRSTVMNSLYKIESEMSTLLSLSFFITKNMRSQLNSGPVYGTLPVIYVFLARSGKTIHETKFVNIDNEGNEKPADDPGAKNSASKGVKIEFSAGDGPKQTLYYFSTNLANDGVKTSGFLAFCEKLGVADAFVKSASYLLHSGNFSTVRNFMLDHSATILQDDSGIPVRYFDRKQWQLHPFGRYLGPISIFAQHYQPQMSEVFRRQATPMDFGLGYRWRTNESNLLLAQKTADPKPEPKPEPKPN
jgi:hypothetical protein